MKLFGIIAGKWQVDRVTTALCTFGKHKTLNHQSVINDKFKPIPADSVPIWGHIMPPRGKMFKRFYRSEHKRNFYYIDHAYFLRGHKPPTKPSPGSKHCWYRISKNGHMQTTLKENIDASRWEKLFAPLYPVRKYHKDGKHILVCPLGSVVGGIYGQDADEWLQKTIATLKKNTDREIRVRYKPIIKKGKLKAKVPLDEDLNNCFAVVTHSSTVAVHAQLAGIPTFCDKTCCALPVSHTDFSLIESPIYDADIRQEWLHTLAWSQFSLPEYSDGTAYKHIKKHMYDGP